MQILMQSLSASWTVMGLVYVLVWLFRGNKVFEPPRFMSASDAANQLLEIIKRRENDGQPLQGIPIASTFKYS